ncbi:MAG: PEP-CTERM sorting domain-containing protein [Tepidisphaeraceae bacterium]
MQSFLSPRRLKIAAAVACGLGSFTPAATYTWTGTAGDGVWQTGTSVSNWVDETSAVAYAPGNGGGNSFVFSATGVNTATITLKNGHNPNINNMIVNANAAQTTFVIDGASHLDFAPTADGGESLTVNGGSNAVINATAPTGTATGGGNVQLFSYNENAWRVSSGVFTINAPIVGSGASRGISKRGGGTLRLTGDSTFGGMFVAGDGTIEISSIGNIGETSAAGTGSGITNGQIQISRTTSSSHLNGTLTYTGADATTNRAILIAKDTWANAVTDAAKFTSTVGTLTLTGGITATAGGDISHFTNFTVGGNGNMVVNTNGIFGDLSLIKTGTGRVEINADSLWRGNTTVTAGTLLINANHTVIGGGTYAVQNGGTLGGDGAIAGTITVDSGGTLRGGDSLNVTSVAINGMYDASLLASGSAFGSLVSSGPITLGETALLSITADAALALGQTFTIIDTPGQLNGTFAGLADGALVWAGPNAYEIHYTNGDVTLTTVVPEPAALALFSLAGLAALRRRR